jgi:hypothetical protein
VEANRIWQHLFGSGLVATPDDFGSQGEPPSHPELLDHLATRLIRSGWSRKAMIRAIVSSAAYRQTCAHRPEVGALDAENRGVHRQNRFRLEAEIVHDVTLAAVGLLDQTMGGPGVWPRLPGSFKSFAYRFQWHPDRGPAGYRRGVYIFFQRNMVFPMLRTLDRSDTNLTCVRRERSNTPMQALTLLNDPQFIEAYRALGLQILRIPGVTAPERVDALARRCLGRDCSGAERERLLRLFESLRDQYSQASEAAQALAGAAPGIAVALEDIASWIGVARVIMNLDSFTSSE